MKFSNNIISSTKTAYQNWREPENMHLLARLYWHVLLAASALIMCAVIAYGATVLFSINDDAGTGKSVPASVTIDKTKLTKLLAGFANRQATFESMKNDTTGVADPSR